MAVAIPAAAHAQVTYNSAPSVGFNYGSGNDYSPANAAVLAGTNELALRFHETFERAPASDANGVYSFALGTQPLSFDWSITTADGFTSPALITIAKLGVTSGSYNPLAAGNDNYVAIAGTAQNSFRPVWALGPLFTPDVDSTYRVTLTYGAESLSVDAKFGAGAAVPEPATWALMILGFGATGMAARGSTRKTGTTVLA